MPMKHENQIILLTRPLAAARSFEKQLGDLRLKTLVSPVQAIEPLEFCVPSDMKGAIFTSRNGVEAVKGQPLPCWCVGAATMQAAEKSGWLAKSADGDVEALLRRILADTPVGPLVHFRGQFARGNLAERLREEGISAQEVVAYKQVSQPLNKAAKLALEQKKPVILPLFSPRSAAQLVQQGPFAAPLYVVAMSDAVASEAMALDPDSLVIAKAPDAKSMIAAIKQVANAL